MRAIFYMLFLAGLIASSGCKSDQSIKKSLMPAFQSIIDAVDVEGAILIFDPEEQIYYSNNFEWCSEGRLPASTFKIPNSIVALETGVMENDSTLIPWNGKPSAMQVWEQDLHFYEAFHYSCVPCYQKIARSVGAERMNAWLQKLAYGHMQVNSGNIDRFWLEGRSHINPYEQIDFLKRLYQGELDISESTHQIMKRMLVIRKTPDYTLSGKTGWSIRNGNNNGWFVGYLEASGKVYFFATNISPREDFNMKLFGKIRKEITMEAFKKLELTNPA